MEGHATYWVRKLNIINVSILPKLIYTFNSSVIKYFSVGKPTLSFNQNTRCTREAKKM